MKRLFIKKFLKRVMFTLKTMGAILLGIVKPIQAIVEPDGTLYRTKLKGVMSDNGCLETWAQLKDDFCGVLKEM